MYETTTPLSRAEALDRLWFVPPDSAHSIWIKKEYVGPGHFGHCARFQADPIDMTAWIHSLTNAPDEKWKRLETPPAGEVPDPDEPAWFSKERRADFVLFRNGKTPLKSVWLSREMNLALVREAD